MSSTYSPIISSIEMSKYGYWKVTVSTAPWLRVAVLICKVGITQQEACESALLAAAAIPAPKG
jgi:hypothetical protein